MLMRVICGLIRPTSGEVVIDNQILGKDIEFPQSVGVLIEHPGLIEGYTALKTLKTLADVKKITTEEQIRNLLERLGLDPDNKKKVKKYSLGMKQKVGIAEAFIDNPDLLILDEPFNALDAKTVEIVENMIKEYKNDDRIIIISCHDAALLGKVCDEIYNMEEGKIVEA